MDVHVGQIYIENDTDYGFSHVFQNKISEELTQLIRPSPEFISEYGDDFELIFNMSAKSYLPKNEVRGPTVFRNDKDVEYTIFIPFDLKTPMDEVKRRFALENLFSGIFEILENYKIDTERLETEKERIIDEIISDPTMTECYFDS